MLIKAIETNEIVWFKRGGGSIVLCYFPISPTIVILRCSFQYMTMRAMNYLDLFNYYGLQILLMFFFSEDSTVINSTVKIV